MGKTEIRAQVENFQQLLNSVKGIREGSEQVIRNTVKDLKARAPSWVAGIVTQTYAINKKEIIPGSVRKTKGGVQKVDQAATIRISGETIESFTMQYEGRLLTPVHFGMTPKAPPQGKSYTLKMQVFKGKKQVIGRYKNTRTPGGPFSKRSHNILMGTGNAKEDGTNWIPFQRVSPVRTNIEKFTTVSVPQMVDNKEVNKQIYEKLNEEAAKRLEHHAKRILGK